MSEQQTVTAQDLLDELLGACGQLDDNAIKQPFSGHVGVYLTDWNLWQIAVDRIRQANSAAWRQDQARRMSES